MPNIGSVGWVNIQGATAPTVTHNASTINIKTTIPDGHYSLLYGPISVAEGIEFSIGLGAHVKIKPFADVW